MKAEIWRQVDEIFQAALDRGPGPERAAYIDEACSHDENLRREVEALLSAYKEADDFLETPALELGLILLSEEKASLSTGEILGAYKIIKHLGSGGMGEVYLAQDTRLGRKVALKVLSQHYTEDPEQVRRFQLEARAASALNHQNILTIYEVGQISDKHFIVTEYIDGETLRERIKRERLSLNEALDFAIQIANALKAAHQAGIAHRDIKPENIMLRADNLVKVLDFGLAKLIDRSSLSEPNALECETKNFIQTATGLVLGTVRYMSPEQARGLKVDTRTDIWSLGVVLYEMLEGCAPFTGLTTADILVSILRRKPLYSTNGPRQFTECRRIIQKALEKKPEQRYQSIDELLIDLKTVQREVKYDEKSESFTSIEKFEGHLLTKARDFLEAETLRQKTKNTDDQTSYITFGSKRVIGIWQQYKRIAAVMPFIFLIVCLATFTFYTQFSNRNNLGTSLVDVTGLSSNDSYATYIQMTESQKLEFVRERARRIQDMLGQSPTQLRMNAVLAIKDNVDDYARRTNTQEHKPFKEGLNVIYGRARLYAPIISSVFKERGLPPIVGLYIAMLESEYIDCYENPLDETKGIFQFNAEVAQAYGVAPHERCDAEKMAAGAAKYLLDRVAEVGNNSDEITLAIIGYTMGPDKVRAKLRRYYKHETKERSFWILFDEADRMEANLQNEMSYVPKFFAAAIIGENPQAFGLSVPPLSTIKYDSQNYVGDK